jgi:hypothetical protein
MIATSGQIVQLNCLDRPKRKIKEVEPQRLACRGDVLERCGLVAVGVFG